MLTVGNLGTSYDGYNMHNFNSTFDNLNIFEDSSLPCNPGASNCTSNSYDSWTTNFNKNTFSILAYDVPSANLNSTYYNNTSKQTGYLYFTNYPPDPWQNVSAYLNSTLDTLTHIYK